MAPRAILFSEMTPPPGQEAEFNAWYDDEHIPVRMRAPGFAGAQRYTSTEDAANYLAVYDADTLTAFDTPQYREIKQRPSDQTRRMLGAVSGFTRYLATELDCVASDREAAQSAPVLYAVWFDVPASRLEAFDDWYRNDHVPLLLECADWRMVRRFEVVDGQPAAGNRLALHYLQREEALDSPERRKARASPWRERLAAEPWFKGRYQVFRRLGERFTPPAADPSQPTTPRIT